MFSHFRPIFIAFLGLMLGVWFAELFREGQKVYFIVLMIVLGTVFVASLLKFLIKSKFLEKLWSYNKFFVVTIVSVLIGFGGFFLQAQNFNDETNINFGPQASYTVTGRLKNSPVVYETYATFFIDDVYVVGDGKAYKLEKGIYVKMQRDPYDNITALNDSETGDRISFVGKIRKSEVLSNRGVFMFAYKNDIRYIGNTNTEKLINITKGENSTDLIENMRLYIKHTIFNNMDERNAGLSYAIFVGDLSGLDYDIISNFQSTGVAHLLAVSGINTSLMAIVLVWIFNRLRIKPKYSVLIVTIMLIVYCMICDYCASCLRAALMSVFLLICQAFGKQGDSVNSISLSGIILLLACPMFVFDLSFLLSYACMFGIIFLGPIFYDFFMKCKLGSFISLNLSVTLASTITTLVLCINTFGYVSIVGLLTNLIICPMMEYIYIASFVALIISMIMPFMGFTLWLCQWGLWLVDVITKYIASISFSVVYVDKLSKLFLIWTFVGSYVYSRFLMLKTTKQRTITYSVMALLGVGTFCLTFI